MTGFSQKRQILPELKHRIKSIDYWYVGICVLLISMSIVTLISIAIYGNMGLEGAFNNWRPALAQMLAGAGGLFGALVFSQINYNKLAKFWPMHVICWGLVLLTFVPGIGYAPAGTGSQSWIGLPLGASLQPTELAKISFFLTFSSHLATARNTLNRPKTILPILAHMLAPAVLVHLQGDDGTALVFLVIGFVMLVAAGLNRWVVAAGTAAVAVAAPFIWNDFLGEYQRNRILGLFNPEAFANDIMYQQLQARAAIQDGGVWGLGLMQPQHNYVPRMENDFIFSYFAESCGFVGSVLLLGIFFALLGKVLHTAAKAADNVGSFVCVGVFAMLAFQIVVNVGMNLMLLPVAGITLPLFSAGGSSVLTVFFAIGLVMSVQRVQKASWQVKQPMFLFD